MKIDSSAFKAPPLRPTNTPSPKPPESPGGPGEAVSLSQAASTIQVSEKPAVNLSRIQEIKTAIAEGRFKINPEAIADGLLETARELVNSQRRA